jgi:rhamnosyltransferase
MINTYKSDIVAIVVTYQPELGALKLLLEALTPQVNSVVLVDNGSNADLQNWLNQEHVANVELILLHENRGIAAAHNIGIELAINQEAAFVLLMDQDSIPATDMVKKLAGAFFQASKVNNIPPIAAGPLCIDARTGEKSFFVTERNGYPARWYSSEAITDETLSIKVKILISSGTLIDIQALHVIGGMRSNYFIDHVDTEWSLRAVSKGYGLLGVPSAKMQHTLGDQVRKVWFFGWRQITYHSPLRDYYMFRNTFLMIQDTKLSFIWQFYLLSRLVLYSGYFLIFTPHRFQRLIKMLIGIAHGVRGVSGKLDLETFKCSDVLSSNLELFQ